MLPRMIQLRMGKVLKMINRIARGARTWAKLSHILVLQNIVVIKIKLPPQQVPSALGSLHQASLFTVCKLCIQRNSVYLMDFFLT